MMSHPKLAAPPIIEVVCGVFFAPIPELDPVILGKFWHDLRDDYPLHAIQPPVMDGFMLGGMGAGPLRTWLISKTEEYVVQVQHDRFYMNWRKRSGAYPRFNDRDGGQGVLSRALAEFERLSRFCQDVVGVRPVVTRAEVTKVDLLENPRHWATADDLRALLPVMASLTPRLAGDRADVTIRVAEAREEGELMLAIHCGMQSLFGALPARGVRVEARMLKSLDAGDDLRTRLAGLNDALNDVFFELVPEAQLDRFGGAA